MTQTQINFLVEPTNVEVRKQNIAQRNKCAIYPRKLEANQKKMNYNIRRQMQKFVDRTYPKD